MKTFHFPLERVLDWRRTQLRMVESELERLHTEHNRIQSGMTDLRNDRITFETRLIASNRLDGTDLAALDAFLNHTRDEHSRMNQALNVCQAKIKGQIEIVSAKRRDVHLLEKVKERRTEIWSADVAREIQQLAEDTHLGRWKRR
jgi:flagellar export protein FliJ